MPSFSLCNPHSAIVGALLTIILGVAAQEIQCTTPLRRSELEFGEQQGDLKVHSELLGLSRELTIDHPFAG